MIRRPGNDRVAMRVLSALSFPPLSALVVALLSIVMALLSSTMSDYIEDTVLFAAGAAPLVLVLGLMVAMNIELKKLDKDSLADPEEML